MCSQKQTKRNFDVNGKIYKSLAELAREACISYNAALKRQQRGFSDFEIFFGKNKTSKVKQSRKKPASSRSVEINGIKYESIKSAYNAIKPKASYNTVKQRIIVSGWSDEEAFEFVEHRNIRTINKRGKSVGKNKLFIVDSKEYHSVRELADTYKLPYALVYNRMHKGWSAEKAVKEPVSETVIVNGKSYRSAQAAWKAVGKTSFITFQGRKNRGFSLDICLGLASIPKLGKYKVFGKVFSTVEEIAKEFSLTVGQINHRLQTMSLEEAITYTPQNKGQYNYTRFRDDPKLAKTIGNFYFVQIETRDGILHKVGITVQPIKSRLNSSKIKIIAQFRGEMKKLFNLEQLLLKKFHDNHYRASEAFDGRTETFIFSEVEEAEVLKTIEYELDRL